ncbi:MAG: hypothetical protein EAZ53_05025 [Bacteroidetes bacterium]|nr:MAG: hypothetical protein EAZ53_05025 [Bacteroidota bacterium]
MARKRRKIGFYYLTVSIDNYDKQVVFNQIITYIKDLPRASKKFNLGDNKFCVLDSVTPYLNDNRYKIVFKSATHSFRPNLIHQQTIDERENPKQIQEGEIEKTHILIKAINGDLVVIFEKHLGGIGMNQLVKYLNNFTSQFQRDQNLESFRFGHEIIVKDDFLEEIANLNRVTSAEIYVDKQILGGDALNFSNRTNQVKHEVVVSVKANNRSSISEFANDLYASFNGGENRINKIRLVGKNHDNNDVVIKTDFIERQEYINPEMNTETGEISTHDIFTEMENVLYNFN